ncbi:ATP-binding protein [bacterium]|nr:ATP-binding protein [bacterium]|tara:strand:- start:5692 stop:6201 length:510 start_codon:yes stop_codon:yes gene_type:complete
MGQLWVICGPAGVGKSTYGRKLAAEKGACFLDSDTVTEPVVRAGMVLAGLNPNDRDSPDYKVAFREPVYECLFATAAENLPQNDVVLVGPFTSEIRDPDWRDGLEERFKTPVQVVFVSCDDLERKRRIELRGHPRDDFKLRNWSEYVDQGDVRPPAFTHEHIVNQLLKS